MLLVKDNPLFRLQDLRVLFRLPCMSSLVSKSEGGSRLCVFYEVKMLVVVK